MLPLQTYILKLGPGAMAINMSETITAHRDVITAKLNYKSNPTNLGRGAKEYCRAAFGIFRI